MGYLKKLYIKQITEKMLKNVRNEIFRRIVSCTEREGGHLEFIGFLLISGFFK